MLIKTKTLAGAFGVPEPPGPAGRDKGNEGEAAWDSRHVMTPSQHMV